MVDAIDALLKAARDDLSDRLSWGGPTMGRGVIEARIKTLEEVRAAVPRRGEPIAYLRTYPRDGSKFLAFAAMTGPLPDVQTLDNGTIIQNTPLYG